MPLVTCPDCGHRLSSAALACPSCGRSITPAPTLGRVLTMGAVLTAGTFPFTFFLSFMIVYHFLRIENWTVPALILALGFGFIVAYGWLRRGSR